MASVKCIESKINHLKGQTAALNSQEIENIDIISAGMTQTDGSGASGASGAASAEDSDEDAGTDKKEEKKKPHRRSTGF